MPRAEAVLPGPPARMFQAPLSMLPAAIFLELLHTHRRQGIANVPHCRLFAFPSASMHNLLDCQTFSCVKSRTNDARRVPAELSAWQGGDTRQCRKLLEILSRGLLLDRDVATAGSG